VPPTAIGHRLWYDAISSRKFGTKLVCARAPPAQLRRLISHMPGVEPGALAGWATHPHTAEAPPPPPLSGPFPFQARVAVGLESGPSRDAVRHSPSFPPNSLVHHRPTRPPAHLPHPIHPRRIPPGPRAPNRRVHYRSWRAQRSWQCPSPRSVGCRTPWAPPPYLTRRAHHLRTWLQAA